MLLSSRMDNKRSKDSHNRLITKEKVYSSIQVTLVKVIHGQDQLLQGTPTRAKKTCFSCACLISK